MERQFQLELESLKTSLIKMGSLVEDGYRLAVAAFFDHDRRAGLEVIISDERIDALELEIDNAIIDLLALRQPVAKDLRFIIGSQKLNNDLERIGDHCVNLAQSALTLLDSPGNSTTGGMAKTTIEDIRRMAEIVQRMLRDALDSFIRLDPGLAEEVLENEQPVDDLNRKTVKLVVEALKAEEIGVETGMELARLSRNLERIADLSTNIAEEVVFLTQARVIKHQGV
jgi:phosphate transport system protein